MFGTVPTEWSAESCAPVMSNHGVSELSSEQRSPEVGPKPPTKDESGSCDA